MDLPTLRPNRLQGGVRPDPSGGPAPSGAQPRKVIHSLWRNMGDSPAERSEAAGLTASKVST